MIITQYGDGSTIAITPKSASKAAELTAMGEWGAPVSSGSEIECFGFKVGGGGPHQSKTMMLAELTTLLAARQEDEPRPAILDHNVLGKPSVRARKAALDNMRRLYAFEVDAPIAKVMRRLWNTDPNARPILALLCALARDPLLRMGAAAVLDAKLGEQIKWPALAALVEAKSPGRFSRKMNETLARNAASSWTQAGFLKGAVRKERVRPHVNPVVAAYAALLASLAGFSGARLLESRWMDVLDRPIEERTVLLRQAEGLGLARVRSAGDVLEIEVRRPMADAAGVPSLVHG